MAGQDDNKPGDAQQPGPENQDQQQGLSFPPIGEEHTDAPAEGADAGDGGTPSPQDEVAQRLQALEQRLDQEREQWQQREQRYQSTIDRLIQGQVAQAQPQPQQQQPQQPAIDFEGLPDPVDNYKEFQRQLAERLNTTLQSYGQSLQQQITQQGTTQQRLDQLWQQFQQRHPDLAQRQALVNGVIAMERQEFAARGVDPASAILADPDGFMERVANRMRMELGETGSGAQPSQPAPQGHQPPQTIGGQPPAQPNGQPNGQQVNRTAGVSGGTTTRTSRPGGQQPLSFIEALKREQQEAGLI